MDLLLAKNRLKQVLGCILIFIDFLFFSSSMFKLEQGGYWSFIIAIVPLGIILIYYFGQKKMRAHLKSMSLRDFLNTYKTLYPKVNKIDGSGLSLCVAPAQYLHMLRRR
jgi:K+ transporter